MGAINILQPPISIENKVAEKNTTKKIPKKAPAMARKRKDCTKPRAKANEGSERPLPRSTAQSNQPKEEKNRTREILKLHANSSTKAL